MYVRLVRTQDGLSRDSLFECSKIEVIEISRPVPGTGDPMQEKGVNTKFVNGKLFMLDEGHSAAFEVMQGEPDQVYVMNRDGKTIERYTGV